MGENVLEELDAGRSLGDLRLKRHHDVVCSEPEICCIVARDKGQKKK